MFKIFNKRWAVQLSSPDQIRHIPRDHVDLSTRICGQDGSELLVYRDNFTAYKAANYAGARVLAGYLSADDGHDHPNTMRLGSGERLTLDIPLDLAAPQFNGQM